MALTLVVSWHEALKQATLNQMAERISRIKYAATSFVNLVLSVYTSS